MSEEKQTDEKETASKTTKKSSVKIPTAEQMLEAGVHFGHETKRWNPKMGKNIYTSKENIHIIDIYKTGECLEKAVEFLEDAASRGPVVFVGTKRQAADIIRESAVLSGAHFVNRRWAGGLLTNFKKVRESFIKLMSHEKGFEEGVEGRTKYEVSLMKKEWAKLDRLYSGIKSLDSKPTAVIVVDAKFEKAAVRESRTMGIPVVGILDTNTDPEMVNYPIPANDDAISSIKLLIGTLAEAVKAGNKGKGIVHKLKDYSKVEVEIIKTTKDNNDEVKVVDSGIAPVEKRPAKMKKVIKRAPGRSGESKGILEKVQDAKKNK